MKKVLAIAVHPDDETLGCGGTLLKHKSEGDSIGCIFVTSGNAQQKNLLTRIAAEYSFNVTEFMDKEENTLDDLSLNELIPAFSKLFNTYQPSVLYIPNRTDTHSDHRRVFDAISACIKSFRYPFIKKVMMCEVISETDLSPSLIENSFIPNVFVDISEFRDQKLKILEVYSHEILDDPHTRSWSAIEALERYRGSQVSIQYAEAFMLIKEVC
jgi:LmbE family N-acetylglucosaminyl deacetylase